VLKRVESTKFSRATTVVYTQEYPITLPEIGTGQMSMLNARCLHIQILRQWIIGTRWSADVLLE